MGQREVEAGPERTGWEVAVEEEWEWESGDFGDNGICSPPNLTEAERLVVDGRNWPQTEGEAPGSRVADAVGVATVVVGAAGAGVGADYLALALLREGWQGLSPFDFPPRPAV